MDQMIKAANLEHSQFRPGPLGSGMIELSKEELIKRAVSHTAVGLELINQLWAVHSFADQDLVAPYAAKTEIIMLIDKFHTEMGQTSALLKQFLVGGET